MGVGDEQLSPALPSAFMSRSVTFRDKKTGLPVTDRDERLGTAGLSKSVTFRGLENVFLLQIETFGTWLGECLNL